MSCVRPGVLLTNASRRRPASVLIALDLPALERPAKAISGAPGRGRSRGSCTDIEYDAFASGNSVKFRGFAVPLFFATPLPRGFPMRVFTGFALMALVYSSAF